MFSAPHRLLPHPHHYCQLRSPSLENAGHETVSLGRSICLCCPAFDKRADNVKRNLRIISRRELIFALRLQRLHRTNEWLSIKLDNSKGQTPCLVAAYLGGVCYRGSK